MRLLKFYEKAGPEVLTRLLKFSEKVGWEALLLLMVIAVCVVGYLLDTRVGLSLP